MLLRFSWLILPFTFCCNSPVSTSDQDPQTQNGYRGIWFELGQKLPYGDKYSGGLGTYTAKHMPTGIYAPEVEKTFFVYGGTTADTARHLQCMIGCYDHRTNQVAVPQVVYDKAGVDDPHDNPSLLIDDRGYLWVFVSGRGTKRSGFKFRSNAPFDISAFEEISEKEMTYPQPWYDEQNGFFHFFTKYSGIRELYFETSTDGIHWSEDQKLAGIVEEGMGKAGHYQVSGKGVGKVGTFFNRHRDGHPDARTDLYYLETLDFGKTWQTIEGETIETPVTEVNSPARVTNYWENEKNVYMKDMLYDESDKPYVLHLVSNGHEPGPENMPYEWILTFWDGGKWVSHTVTESDHNYDMGSLFLSDTAWHVVAPSLQGPQRWAAGGEVVILRSDDRGVSWQTDLQLTQQSAYNHAYVRKVHDGRSPFHFFWADGHGHEFSPSRLYYGNMQGQVWILPDTMEAAQVSPQRHL